MKEWNHFTREHRNAINSALAHKKTAYEIGEIIDKNASSISKEVKRHRYLKSRHNNINECPKLKRWPHVCNGCSSRYGICGYNKYIYDPEKAQRVYEKKKVECRNHVTFTDSELSALSNHIKSKCEDGASVLQAILSFKDYAISESNIYALIKKGKLSEIEKMIVSQRKRRQTTKQYEYKENININRSGRTYIDFLKEILFKNVIVCEMDFLGKTPGKHIDILTLSLRHINLTLIFEVKNKNSSKIVGIFDYLEKLLGTEIYNKLFGIILTDREPSFADYMGIEFNKETGEQRSKIFYCDPYVSTQKAFVENRNRLLRKHISRSMSDQEISQMDLKGVESYINNMYSKTLSNNNPKNILINVFGKEVYNKLVSREIKF